MDKNQEARSKGQQASNILNDEAFRGAADQVSKDLYAAWAASKWYEIMKREFIYRQFRALNLLETRLKTVMDQGKVAQSELEKANR